MDMEQFLSENQPTLNQPDTKTRFTGKAVIVTGGSSGIGRCTVERFLNGAASVAIFDIDDVNGAKVVTWAESKGFKLSYFKVDVTQEDQCVSATAIFAEQNGGLIHYLVNGAAYFGSKGLDAVQSDWQKSFSVNVVAYANMVQAVYPYMKKSSGGAIVNISSAAAHRARKGRWTYSATKGAVYSMTKVMALDLAADNIRVNSVAPSWIWSPEVAKLVNGDRSKHHPLAAKLHMLQRHGELSEVAAVITFLCSKDASFMTGSNIPVDGGYLAMSPEQHGDTSQYAGTEY